MVKGEWEGLRHLNQPGLFVLQPKAISQAQARNVGIWKRTKERRSWVKFNAKITRSGPHATYRLPRTIVYDLVP